MVEVITRGGQSHPAPAAMGAQTMPEHSKDAVPATLPPQPVADTVHLATSEPFTRRSAPRWKAAKTPWRPTAETRELAANLRGKFPAMTQAELARRLGISATRLRQVERAEGPAERAHPINGADMPQRERVSA
ncbi:MAG TPA: helix-turn-helix transcriptional regulator [Micromonosporaceae bacterium]|nr:helix-turn-helix transcriptional regulator [Micromonosporaceae bacterium]